MSTRNLAIMFTDIQGFTARTSASTREGIHQLLDVHEHLLKPVFDAFRGNVVKTIGDAFLVWFESPTDAVLCGLTVQEVLRQYNEKATEKLHVRVSINAGDVELREDPQTKQVDVYGEAVNLAARLEGITEAGEVWFTEAVYLTMNRAEAPSAEIGERTFKGIPNPVRVYKVVWEPGSEHARQLASRVQFKDGRPSISRDLPKEVERAAAGPKSRLPLMIAGVVIAALLFIGIVTMLVKPGITKRNAMRDAVALAKEKKDLEALDALGRVLDVDASDKAALDLSRMEIAAEIAKPGHTWKEELGRLDGVLGKHAALKSALSRERGVVEVKAIVDAAIEEGDQDWMKTVREYIHTDSDSPLLWIGAADELAALNRNADVIFWLRNEGMKRGAKHEPRYFDEAVHFFLTSWDSDTDICADVRKSSAEFFPDAMDAWARKAVSEESNAYAFRNGLAYFIEKKDPLGDRADLRAIDAFLAAPRDKAAEARKILLDDKDATHRAHAVTILEGAESGYSFGRGDKYNNRLDVVALLADLKK